MVEDCHSPTNVTRGWATQPVVVVERFSRGEFHFNPSGGAGEGIPVGIANGDLVMVDFAIYELAVVAAKVKKFFIRDV